MMMMANLWWWLLLFVFIDYVRTDPVFLEAERTAYKIIRGETLTLNCTINAPHNVAQVSWKRDDVFMEKVKRFPKELYSENRLVLMIPDATDQDSALYTCIVQTKDDDIHRRNFNVPPISAPTIQSMQKRFLKVKVNSPVRFKCVVSKYFTDSYRWLFGGKEITAADLQDTRYKIKKYQFFKIRRVMAKDSGTYTCSVSNAMGTNEVIYFLDVVVRGNETSVPRLVRQESQNTLLVEIVMNDINLDCRVTGSKPINITWLKDDQPLTKRDPNYEFLHENQTLKLVRIIPSDQGVYRCVAQNKYGKMTHEMTVEAVEKKISPPIFLDKNPSHYIDKVYNARIGQNLTVKTHSVTFGNVHFQLLIDVEKFNNVTNTSTMEFLVLNTPRHYVVVKTTEAASEYRVEFYFTNLTKKDFQNYTIMAGNVIGYDVFKFAIIEEPVIVTTTPAALIATPNQKNDFIGGPIFIVLVLCACFLVFATLATFLYCLRSKRGFNNNDNTLYSKERFERVVLNLDSNNSPKPGTPRRMSSCQTEKEYITSHAIPVDPDWEVAHENIEFHKLLGEGAFGRVMLGLVHELPRHSEPTTVAIKMLKNDATEKELKDLLSEMQVMKTIGKHVNIINLLGVSTQQDELCMIVEYCRYGNLRDFLKDRRPTLPPCLPQVEQLTMQNLISYCLQVAKGMDYLSSKKCIHRDIAARNVLVADEYVMKIADFGLARDIHGDEYYRKHTDGRLPVKWMALEALFDRVYTTQSDVWSYGILMWEIVTFGGSPYPGVPFEKLCDLLNEGYRMERPVNCTDELYRLMSSCWKPEPTTRPNFSSICDDLEQALLNTGGVEYLQLQLIDNPYPTESSSSEQSSPTDSRVFDDDNSEDDNEDMEASAGDVLMAHHPTV